MSDSGESFNSDDVEEVLRDIEGEAGDIVKNLLPDKSSPKYMICYESFSKWMADNKTKSYSEEVFLVYFNEMAKNLKPSTLWSRWSMLKTVMNLHHEIDLDEYKRLKQFLKNKSKGFLPKKSQVFSLAQIQDFIENGPDNVYLAMKIIAIFGISGAMRTVEFCNLKTTDVEDAGTKFIVSIRDTKNYYPRSFVIGENYYQKVVQYINLTPKDIETNRFFLGYQRGKCTRQVIGKNKFGETPKTIAIFLNLQNPERFTGHCFRRTSATLLANSGASLTTIKSHGDWKSSTVAEGYIENSVGNKTRIFNKIIDSEKPSTSTSTSYKKLSPSVISPSTSKQPENSHIEKGPVTTDPSDFVNVTNSPSIYENEGNNTSLEVGISPSISSSISRQQLPENFCMNMEPENYEDNTSFEVAEEETRNCNDRIPLKPIDNLASVQIKRSFLAVTPNSVVKLQAKMNRSSNIPIRNTSFSNPSKIPSETSNLKQVPRNFLPSAQPSKKFRENGPIERSAEQITTQDALSTIISTPSIKLEKCKIDNLIINNYYYYKNNENEEN